MELLLDTHASIWLLEGDNRLSALALAAVEEADRIFMSVASFWEIGIKQSIGKLRLEQPLSTYFYPPGELGFKMLHPAFAEIEIIASLPLHHRDPFDRMLVAQAITHGFTIVTKDQFIPLYGVPVLW